MALNYIYRKKLKWTSSENMKTWEIILVICLFWKTTYTSSFNNISIVTRVSNNILWDFSIHRSFVHVLYIEI